MWNFRRSRIAATVYFSLRYQAGDAIRTGETINKVAEFWGSKLSDLVASHLFSPFVDDPLSHIVTEASRTNLL